MVRPDSFDGLDKWFGGELTAGTALRSLPVAGAGRRLCPLLTPHNSNNGDQTVRMPGIRAGFEPGVPGMFHPIAALHLALWGCLMVSRHTLSQRVLPAPVLL